MIATFARLYVNVVEPAAIILAIIIALAFILYLFTVLRGGDAKNSLAGKVVNLTFIAIMKILKFIGLAIAKFMKLLLRTIVVIFATMRDFFKSKI